MSICNLKNKKCIHLQNKNNQVECEKGIFHKSSLIEFKTVNVLTCNYYKIEFKLKNNTRLNNREKFDSLFVKNGK